MYGRVQSLMKRGQIGNWKVEGELKRIHRSHHTRINLVPISTLVSMLWISVSMRQPLVCVSFRGERAVHHDHNKNISKGHRHPPRLWDVKARPFEAQNWHHNPTRSFHHRAGTNNGYVTGPGDRYANWDHSVSNSVVRRPTDLEALSVFSDCAIVFFGYEQTFSLD